MQVQAPVQTQAPVQVQAPVVAQAAAPISMAQEAPVAPQPIAVSEPVQIAALAVRPEAPAVGAPAPLNAASSAVSGTVPSAAPTAAPVLPPAVSQSIAAPDSPPPAIAPLQPERETGAAALAAPQASAGSPADPAQSPLLAQAIVRPMLTALPEPEKPAEQLLASTATLQDIYAMRNGRLKLEVDAPAQLTIAKDALQFSVRSNTAGYLYAVMLGSDGRSFYLLLPNKLDGDNRIRANTTYRFPRPGWAIKAGGPEGVNHLLFVVSQSPRDPRVFVPAGSDEGGGVFTFAVTDLIARQRLIDFFVGRGVQGRNRQMAAAMVTIKEVP